MKRYGNAAALLLILIIAGGLRLYHLSELPPGLYPDEAMNGNNALEVIHSSGDRPLWTGFKVFYPENNGREGLFINIQAIFLKALGTPPNGAWEGKPWVLRLPSAIFGIFTVLGLYFLGRELFSKRVGLLSAFFLATSFWHINFSRVGFRAIMAPFFAVWAVYFFLHGVRRYSDGKKFPALFYAGIGGLFLGLGMYSYIAFRVMPLVFVAMVPFFAKRKGFWKCAAVLATAAILVATPIGLYYLENPADFMGRTAQVSVLSSAAPLKDLGLNALKTLGMFNFAGDWNWRHNFAGRPEVFWPVGIFLWAGAILALRAIWKKFAHGEDKGYAMASSLMSAWAAMAALPVIASNEGLPHALRAILLIPPAMLFAGWGADRIYQKIVRLSHAFHTGDRLAKTARLASAALFVMLAAEGATTYFLLWGKNPNVQGAFAAEQVELGKKLLSLPDKAPKYVVVKARGVDVRGIPMPAQTVMFVTDTFLPESRAARNIHYVLPEEEQNIPLGAMKFYIE